MKTHRWIMGIATASLLGLLAIATLAAAAMFARPNYEKGWLDRAQIESEKYARAELELGINEGLNFTEPDFEELGG